MQKRLRRAAVRHEMSNPLSIGGQVILEIAGFHHGKIQHIVEIRWQIRERTGIGQVSLHRRRTQGLYLRPLGLLAKTRQRVDIGNPGKVLHHRFRHLASGAGYEDFFAAEVNGRSLHCLEPAHP